MAQSRGKFIPARQIDVALEKAEVLLVELRKIQRLPFATVDIEDGIYLYAKSIIEKGESLESVIAAFQADLLRKLIELGYDNDVKLGELLKKKPTAVKVYRCGKGVFLRKK